MSVGVTKPLSSSGPPSPPSSPPQPAASAAAKVVSATNLVIESPLVAAIHNRASPLATIKKSDSRSGLSDRLDGRSRRWRRIAGGGSRSSSRSMAAGAADGADQGGRGGGQERGAGAEPQGRGAQPID